MEKIFHHVIKFYNFYRFYHQTPFSDRAWQLAGGGGYKSINLYIFINHHGNAIGPRPHRKANAAQVVGMNGAVAPLSPPIPIRFIKSISDHAIKPEQMLKQ